MIAEALLHEVRDPRIGLATVTRVEVSPDLSVAKILVAVHGEPAERDAALEGLESATGFFRSKVARALSTRTTPELVFRLDRAAEHVARIDEILGAIKRGEEAP